MLPLALRTVLQVCRVHAAMPELLLLHPLLQSLRVLQSQALHDRLQTRADRCDPVGLLQLLQRLPCLHRRTWHDVHQILRNSAQYRRRSRTGTPRNCALGELAHELIVEDMLRLNVLEGMKKSVANGHRVRNPLDVYTA
eukprot:TRINITY_DN1518_c0_g1_i10.p2 TRINITY_DN1518_c0_g1~~TRINITY_DN1518_c0_g1_i10.p2  ORF type:complete len:139 (-),score=15.16 TRINITY_DN1518_c0_g1_i10:1209-1625(-)